MRGSVVLCERTDREIHEGARQSLGVRLTTREIGPTDWAVVESLFGSNGACGGCWCQHWHLEKGEKWEEIKGPVARARFQDAIESSRAHGILAFVDGVPMGWAAFGPKSSFARLERSPRLRSDDAGEVWALPCFFVKASGRGQGLASEMLSHAIRAIAARGGAVIEAYPVRPKAGAKVAAAFAWTGTLSLFEKAGFHIVDDPGVGKVRVRLIP